MPSDTPKPGRCGATLRGKPGTFCSNKPAIPDSMGGNGRCKFHGGFLPLAKSHLPTHLVESQQQEARLRHGLYSSALAGLFKKAKHQLLYADESTAKIDLTAEIRLWRTKVYTWQEQLANGMELFETDHDKFIPLEDLIARGTAVLMRLMETQKKLHPNADATGELTINIVMDGNAQKQAAELDMPDLEAGVGEERLPENPKDADADVEVKTPRGALDDFLGEGD